MGCALTLAAVLVLTVAGFQIAGRLDRQRAAAKMEADLEKRRAARRDEPDLQVTGLGAFSYSGEVYFKVNPRKQLVAVDLEISHGGPWFMVDQIEIINGETGRSYGDKPEVVPLSKSGEPLPNEIPSETSRVRLIYQVPGTCKSVNLWWGDAELLAQPLTIQPRPN